MGGHARGASTPSCHLLSRRMHCMWRGVSPVPGKSYRQTSRPWYAKYLTRRDKAMQNCRNNEIKKGRRKSKLSAKVTTSFRGFNLVVARVEHQLPRGIGKIFARKVCTLLPCALLGFAKHGIPCQIQVKLACVCFLVHNQIIPYKTARFCYGGCGSDGGGVERAAARSNSERNPARIRNFKKKPRP